MSVREKNDTMDNVLKCPFCLSQTVKPKPGKTTCPECSEEALRKVYLPVGIVFKGSGFYATDNRSPSGTKRSAEGKSNDGDKNEKSDKTAKSESSESKKSESSAGSDKTKD